MAASGRRMEKDRNDWSVAEAKAKFSELIDAAGAKAQTVTRNGKPVAVVVSAEEWARRTRRNTSLSEFFRRSPLAGSELDLDRERQDPRDVDL